MKNRSHLALSSHGHVYQGSQIKLIQATLEGPLGGSFSLLSQALRRLGLILLRRPIMLLRSRGDQGVGDLAAQEAVTDLETCSACICSLMAMAISIADSIARSFPLSQVTGSFLLSSTFKTKGPNRSFPPICRTISLFRSQWKKMARENLVARKNVQVSE